MLSRSTFSLLIAPGLIVAACYVVSPASDKETKQSVANEREPTSELVKGRYGLPTGGVKDLLAFIKHLHTIRSATPNEEYEAHAFPAMKAAADKIQQIATEDDRKRPGFTEATEIWLYFRVSDSGDNPNITDQKPLTPAERNKLLGDIKAHFKTTEDPSHYAMVAALLLARNHEDAHRTKLAAEIYADLGSSLAVSQNPKVATLGAQMQGAARRLDLPGNLLELKGTITDGTKFDWTKYRGKVVLVEFWATWCGPCREELPNVKKNYDLYHPLGFDVVGISVDDDRSALDKYLAEVKLPWVTLHDGPRQKNPIANYYGIMGVPTILLVDREGKVMSLDPRGSELKSHLEKLLGNPEPAKTPEKKPAE